MTNQSIIMDGRQWAQLLFLSILWGATFFFVGVAVKEVPPLTIVFIRVALAALLLLPVFFCLGHQLPKSLKDWQPYFVMGLLNNVLPFSLLFAGQTYLTAGLASIINAMTPLFAVLIMAGFGDERLNLHRIIGILMGVAGVAVLRGFDGQLVTGQTIGIVLCLGGSICYGFAGLWGRRNLIGIAPLKSATCQLICSSVIMVFVASIYDQPWSLNAPSLNAWLAIIGLAFFGTAMAYLIYFKLLQHAGATNVLLVTLLVPVTALFLGIYFLGENISDQQSIGALIIAIALLFLDGRVFKVFKTP